jgi:hypothetical protein
VGDGSLAAAACAGVPHRVERENIKDFLAKKRETFLVQVGLILVDYSKALRMTARAAAQPHASNSCVLVLCFR